MNNDRSNQVVVVLSGGQDSTTCLFWARKNFREVHAITFDYGQRHRAEIDAAMKVASLAGVASHRIVAIPEVLRSTSPLLSDNALETYIDFDSMDATIGSQVELTFVPMRNTFFLTIAANHALALGCRDLMTGVCQADDANYPDCREDYINTLAFAFNQSLGIDDFKIHTPLMHFSKEESIYMACDLDGCYDALAYSHTCYAGQVPPCGKCHACVLRAHGFADARVADPLVARFGGAHVRD